jgi:hypothetical protein
VKMTISRTGLRKVIAIACVSSIVLLLSVPSGFVQPVPSSTSICDMPSQRGTAMYNKYCGSGVSSRNALAAGAYAEEAR